MNADELATGEADAVADSVDDLMSRYDGTEHDDECERTEVESARFAECGQCGGRLFHVRDIAVAGVHHDNLWKCDNGHEITGQDVALEWNEEGDAREDETGRLALYLITYTDPDAECSCQDRARDELDERPLELVAQLGSPFEIVLGVGGPDSRIVWDGRYGTDSARLEVSWGSGDVTRRSSGIRAMADYYAEMMEADQ